MLLLKYLPLDKSSFYAPMYNAAVEGEEYISESQSGKPPKGWWKKELDRRRGRNRPRDTISIEQFMKEVKR
tara:strand:+ start:964 stop:1176 length:213 start_codon:yes stop_codon:yes gene_type:complete